MVQIIDSPKSFGSQLVSGLANAAPGIGDALEKLAMKKQRSALLDKLGLQDFAKSPEEIQNYAIQQKIQQNAKIQEEERLEKKLSKSFGDGGMTFDKYKSGSPDQRAAFDRLYPKEAQAYRKELILDEKRNRPEKKTQASQPIDPDQLRRIQEVRSKPDFKDMDEIEQYQAFTNAGVSKENAEAEAKLKGTQLERKSKELDKSFEREKDFIDNTTNAYKAFQTDTKPKLMQMQKLASDDELIGPTAAVFMEHLGIPLGALDDPSSELYNKLSLDLLKGLPETYGNRILKVEVDNFLQTIPSLLNSPNGRRMIASNMLKLGEMKEVYYNEMRNQQRKYLDENKPLPKDFQQVVFDQVKPKIDTINKEFVKMADIKSVPEGRVPVFNPSGEIEFVLKKDLPWYLENRGKSIW